MRARLPAALVVAAIHLVAALVCRFFLGLRPGPDVWDGYWQHLPADLLRDDLWRSLWNLHSQPPLQNLFGALHVRFFPGHIGETIHYRNMLLGSATAAECVLLLFHFTRSPRFASVAGALLALSPTLLLFEAHPLYTLPCIFLVTTAVTCLAAFEETRRESWLYAFVGTLTLLVLTRSLYHVAFLAAASGFAVIVVRERRRVVAAACLALCLPAAAWCVKNVVKFGVPGTSSWSGLSLYRIAGRPYTDSVKARLAAAGGIDPAVIAHDMPYASRPSAYRAFGFDAVSDVPALSRDDFNDVNIPAISAAYGRAAWSLISDHPQPYLGIALTAYRSFCEPSTGGRPVRANRKLIAPLADIYDVVVHVAPVSRNLERVTGIPFGGSILTFTIPVLVAAWFLRGVRRARFSAAAWAAEIHDAPAAWFCTALVVWTVLAGSLFELGENMRFKSMIEPVYVVVVASVLHGTWTAAAVRVRRARG